MIPQCMRKKCDKKCDVFLRCDEKVSQNVTKRIFLGFGFGSLVVVMMQKHQFVTKKCHNVTTQILYLKGGNPWIFIKSSKKLIEMAV